jgi:hypothetical protein
MNPLRRVDEEWMALDKGSSPLLSFYLLAPSSPHFLALNPSVETVDVNES